MSGTIKNNTYIDTNIFINFWKEEEPQFQKLFSLIDSKANFKTSVISLSEILVQPLTYNNKKLYRLFLYFFKDMPIEVVDINEEIAIAAAQIRAEYKNLKLPDALHLATAQNSFCKLFITEDKQLLKLKKIRGMTVTNAKSGLKKLESSSE